MKQTPLLLRSVIARWERLTEPSSAIVQDEPRYGFFQHNH
jgi:hypothetical protein